MASYKPSPSFVFNPSQPSSEPKPFSSSIFGSQGNTNHAASQNQQQSNQKTCPTSKASQESTSPVGLFASNPSAQRTETEATTPTPIPTSSTIGAAEVAFLPRNRALRPSRAAASEVIKVHLQESKNGKCYHLAPDLLKLESKYFEKLLQSNNSTANEKLEVGLPKIKDAAMDIVVDWIYGVALEVQHLSEGPFAAETIDFAIETYAAATILEMPGLQNDLMDILRLHLRATPKNITPHNLQKCLDHDLKESKMWEFCLKDCVYGAIRNKNARAIVLKQSKAVEIERVLGQAILNFLDDPYTRPRLDNGCAYHNHANGKCE